MEYYRKGERGGKRLPHTPYCATETQFLADGKGGLHLMICALWDCGAEPVTCLSTAVQSAHKAFTPTSKPKETNV
jgi:hypothetical protein